jgi:hypothetical protein
VDRPFSLFTPGLDGFERRPLGREARQDVERQREPRPGDPRHDVEDRRASPGGPKKAGRSL